jgi:hypothetical protein
MEKTWKSWFDFYRTSNEMFESDDTESYCDCFRTEGAFIVSENRFYYNKKRNISLLYFQYFGDVHPFRGHWLPSDTPDTTDTTYNDNTSNTNYTSLQLRVPQDTFIPYLWQHQRLQYLIGNLTTAVVPKHSILIVNQGYWDGSHHLREFSESLVKTAFEKFNRVIWKSTTARADRDYTDNTNEADAVMTSIPGEDYTLTCFDILNNLDMKSVSHIHIFITFIHTYCVHSRC